MKQELNRHLHPFPITSVHMNDLLFDHPHIFNVLYSIHNLSSFLKFSLNHKYGLAVTSYSRNTLQRDRNDLHLKTGSDKILLFHLCFNACQNHGWKWNNLLSFNKQHSANVCGGCGGVKEKQA